MTINADQERALLALYEAAKVYDEAYERDEEDPPSYGGPASPALLMWQAMDDVYRAFGYEPKTNRPTVSAEYIQAHTYKASPEGDAA